MLEGKTIVLTGLTGRVGGAFADALAKKNEVHGLARFSAPGQQDFWEQAGVKTHRCDLASGEFAGAPQDPDYVIHVAANVAPGDPETGFRDNAEASGLLLHHCRKAKAFLHVSATGVYMQNPDPKHVYREDVDPVGGGLMGHYTGSKAAAEGAVRAMARALEVPLIVCRLDVAYGVFSNGGLLVAQLAMLLRNEPIPLPKSWPMYHTPINDDDLVAFIEPCLKAADVRPVTLNWSGDEAVRAEDWVRYMADLVGVEPRFSYETDLFPSCIADNTRRMAITGPCKVHWKEGLKRMVEHWAPKLSEDQPALSN